MGPAGTSAVLGYGTIGSLVALQLAARGTGPVLVANRSPGRLAGPLPPGVEPVGGFSEAVTRADVVFLCVPPRACAGVLAPLVPVAGPQTLLVSTAADVSLVLLRGLWPGPVVRLMPTVTSSVGHGTMLIDGAPADVERVQALFPSEAAFLPLSEDLWDPVSAITSCGPGLVAALLQTWTQDLAVRTGWSPGEAEALVVASAAGALALVRESGRDLADLLGRVATPGGITGEGARILGDDMPRVWSRAAEAMEDRHRARREEIGALSDWSTVRPRSGP